ncbi:selenium metabolism-associated LysR family transcriptional regulator [Candidatus Contubernalis alkaliaceticus]|uniref:selenium metabolism-associated LysR family transcriptional regulator n=1 Tax=Candidatus Contubernalis alkaliaceticus TaxID=338645 RepID=UPI001F4BF3E3|nr:selenium metabolism-associated LysR family transcriptional regulator [Candidatus Contubernalis alkalaceticus]UNC90831.1 LysR family transcriptional regulator [Candidatus Contubernalis alkalaceticus]
MQFYQLQAFIKVAEKRSFSRAAEDIFLSQSTVSTHIGSLEKHFGQKLFDRLGKEVTLTPFGEKLFYWAREMIKMRDMALWDLKEWTGKTEGNIHIAASTVPAQFMAPFLISYFVKKYPGIQFTLTQNSSEIVADCLLKGDADLGMLGEKYYSEKIEYIPFLDEKLVLITPADVVFNNPISITEVLDYPFIFRKPGSGTQAVVEKIFKKENIDISRLNVVAYFNNVQSIKQGVKEGVGVSIISEIAAMDYSHSSLINYYHLKELKNRRSFYFAYNRQKTLAPYIQEFISLGRDWPL